MNNPSFSPNGYDPNDPSTWQGYDPQGQDKWLADQASGWNPMQWAGDMWSQAAPMVGGALGAAIAAPAMIGGFLSQPDQPAQPSLENLNPEEAQRQLRMLRARQSYERNFGMASPADSSAAMGNPDDLLARVRQARQQYGWRP